MISFVLTQITVAAEWRTNGGWIKSVCGEIGLGGHDIDELRIRHKSLD